MYAEVVFTAINQVLGFNSIGTVETRSAAVACERLHIAC